MGRPKKDLKEAPPVALDAFDIATQTKRKAGRPKKVVAVEPPVAPVTENEDSEEMSEREASAMAARAEERKAEVKNKLEASVDTQQWSLADPVIPEELKGRVWVAVYRCPEGHKTKATNRQATSGVFCYRCHEAGRQAKATIMEQFLSQPIVDDSNLEKRKKARKGAE